MIIKNSDATVVLTIGAGDIGEQIHLLKAKLEIL
jgi:hypothetical protein